METYGAVVARLSDRSGSGSSADTQRCLPAGEGLILSIYPTPVSGLFIETIAVFHEAGVRTDLASRTPLRSSSLQPCT